MNENTSGNLFGFAHLWASGDLISHTVTLILIGMSVGSWYLILAKAGDWRAMRRAARSLDDFWRAASVGEGIDRLRRALAASPYALLAESANSCQIDYEAVKGRLAERFDPADQMERVLRQQLASIQSDMESGLTLLATTGATAPFVGLFGTVWGIYHALVAIGISGQAALEKVAGPVGEALIMTAAGLAVALPAVFAYNAFNRVNRLLLGDLDAFAHDLYSFFTLGKRSAKRGAQIRPVRAKPSAEVA